MPDPSTIFAWIVTALAAVAVVGALVLLVVWEIYATRRQWAAYRTWIALRRELARDRDPSSRYWREHAAIQPADMIPPPAP
jgi:hypothetical protein